MKKLIVIITLLVSGFSYSHEGHNDTPGSFKSIHGGTVQNGKELNLEIIINGRDFVVYPTNHESKDISSSEVKLSAMAKPKKGKPFPVNLQLSKGGYAANVDLQGSNRLPVEITVIKQGKVDKFTIQIEE